MSVVSLFISRSLYLYPFLVTILPVFDVIPVGFVWSFAFVEFTGGDFIVFPSRVTIFCNVRFMSVGSSFIP